MNKQSTEYVRKYTVEILKKNTGIGVGTGFVISSEGLILTCSHVLEMAGMNFDYQDFSGLKVKFPGRDQKEEVVCDANVIAYRRPEEDDVVLLQIDGICPLGPEKVAVLFMEEPKYPCDFISHGFRYKGTYSGMPAEGRIAGKADNETSSNLRHERLMLKSQDIDQGMSGAPVAVLDRNNEYRVAGIVAETNSSIESFKDALTSMAINSLVFTEDPFKEHLDLQKGLPPSSENPRPSADKSIAANAIVSNLNIEWNDAPPTPDYWVSRNSIMEAIANQWNKEDKRLISLIGPEGIGKTTLARRWTEDLLDERWPELLEPKWSFYWDFYKNPFLEDFFESALNYLGGGNIDQNQFKSINAKMDFLSQMIIEIEGENRSLFILDGFEAMQHHEGYESGTIISDELRQFIMYLTLYGHGLIISTNRIIDYLGAPCHAENEINRMSKHEGRKLLKNLGMNGSKEELDRFIHECKGNPSFIYTMAKKILALLKSSSNES